MLQAEKTEKTRTEILRVAMDIFGEKGYDGASIQEIAEAAGYSVGSVYRHWKNKQQLFINVWIIYVSEFIREQIKLIPESPSVDEMLDYMIERSEKFASNKYTYNLYVLSAITPTGEEYAMMNQWAAEYQNMIYNFLKNFYPETSETKLRTVAGILHGVLNENALKDTEFVVPHLSFDKEALRECLLAIIRTCESK